MHILEGFIIATDHIDEIIKIIRGSMNGEEKDLLMQRFNLSERQAQAILDMQLRRLSGLSRQKTEEEYKFLASEVERLRHILESKENKEEIIKNELLEIKAKYNDKRKSVVLVLPALRQRKMILLSMLYLHLHMISYCSLPI